MKSGGVATYRLRFTAASNAIGRHRPAIGQDTVATVDGKPSPENRDTGNLPASRHSQFLNGGL